MPTATFAPSKYQEAIFDFIKNGQGNAVVDAKAGSGKTTTIVQGMKFIPRQNSVIFLAFNKAIAEALKKKVPSHVEARTLNSLGHGAWMRFMGCKVDLNQYKVRNLADEMEDALQDKYAKTHDEKFATGLDVLRNNKREIVDLVKKAKMAGIAPGSIPGTTGMVDNTDDAWHDLLEHYSIEIDNESIGMWLARNLLRKNATLKTLIDFDDQFYLPLIYGAKFKTYDFVFIDEAQDVSDIQREILRRISKPSTRVIAVGDPNQAVYGFRGANPESLELIAKEFKAKKLPLSICYRCPKAVIEAAQAFVPDIQAAPGAPEGVVKHLNEDWKVADFTQQDMVLCRNTAPLVGLGRQLMGDRIPFVIKGRDIGKELVKLIESLKAVSVKDLIKKLDNWQAKKIKALTRRYPDANVEHITDKVDAVNTLIEGGDYDDVCDVTADLEKMFRVNTTAEPGEILTLSTVHKAKGLEADRVYILNPDLMPSAMAKKDWELIQEDNLQYVAITRAMKELFYISDGR